MTRATIDIVETSTGRRECFYCCHDSYPEGLGKILYLFCKAFHDEKSFNKICDYASKLVDNVVKSEFRSQTDADYLYTVALSPDAPLELKCQKVDWKGDNNRPTRSRLMHPINLEKTLLDNK